MGTNSHDPWWHGVLYHVYLRSFADSDGDGVGDLRGLISKLDHLAWLGVEGAWVSPVMPSPNADWGYDVSDYTAVDPAYGTLDAILRFWFVRGIAGFRIDVVHKMVKDLELRDNPPARQEDSFIERVWGQREQHNADQPENHDVTRRWRAIANVYDEPRVLIGETYLFELARVASYYGDGDELHLNFNIPFLWTPFEADAVRSIIDDTQAAFPRAARPVWNGGSHDISRFPSRWAGGEPRQ